MGNKTFILSKVNLLNTYNLMALLKAPAKEKWKAGLIAFAVLSVAATFIGTMLLMFLVTGAQLAAMGLLHLLPAIGITAVSAIIFMVSLYKANSYLYSFKDFDLLMSLPVTERDVLLSKLCMLYTDSLLYVLFGYIPVAVAYGVMLGAGFGYWLAALGFFFLVPILPVTAAALVALPIAFFSSRSKMSNLFMLIGSVVLLLGCLWLSFASSTITSEEAVLDMVLSAKDVVGFYFPAVWLADGLSGSIPSGLLFTGMSLLAAAAFVIVYAKTFRAINARLTERFSRASYKMKALSVSGRFGALLMREIRGYFSSYIYVLNTAFGVIMATAYIVMLIFMDYESVAAMLGMPGASDMMVPVTLIVFGFCAVMGTTTACSVSIEGRQVWILKSLPVRFADIAKSKIALSLLISAPLLLADTIVMAVVFGFTFAQFASVALVVLLCTLMAALGGLTVNLMLPNMEWKSQVQAVKQSASVIAAMLLHIGILIVPCIAYVLLGMPDLTAYLFGVGAYLFAVCGGLWVFLQTKGEKRFLQL